MADARSRLRMSGASSMEPSREGEENDEDERAPEHEIRGQCAAQFESAPVASHHSHVSANMVVSLYNSTSKRGESLPLDVSSRSSSSRS